jgi:hypothetical protein
VVSIKIKNRKSVLFVPFLFLLLIAASPTSASSSQWFPTEGTTSDYAISYIFYFLNGTIIESNEFDLYYSSSYKAIPSILKDYFTPDDNSFLTSIANNTELTYRYSYTEQSITQWKRMRTIIWDNGSAPDENLNLYYFEDDVFSTWQIISGAFDTVDKNNFWTSMSIGGLLDYWDSTLGVGSTTYNDLYPIIGITSESIIANNPGYPYNQTIVAGREGRVRTINFVRGALVSKGLNTITLTLSLLESESSPGIPSFPIALISIGIVIGVSLLIIKTKRKLH